MTIKLSVNGIKRQIDADPERSLLSVLRDELDLTGSKYGCGEGECGACTILLDGEPIRSCIMRLANVAGKEVTTVEGVEKNGVLHPLQKAFLKVDAMQCGYCTPGMIISGVALLAKNPNPSDEEVIRAMEGNICRCGTYPRIISAIREASKEMR